jgi:protein CpxP
MHTHFKPLHTLILAGALTALTGYSMAQPAPGAGASAGPAAHGQGMGKHDPAKMQTRMTQRLAKLKATLKITPEQEAAWTTFTDSVKPMPHSSQRASMAASKAELKQLPTPERLDRMRAMRTEHMAAMTAQMDQRAEATKTFYAALSTDQKKVFDDQFSPHAGGRGGHRAGPMGGQHERHQHHG